MTVREIVKEYLEKNGYDGLFVDECTCSLEDLMPCDYSNPNCKAGYLVESNLCVDCDLEFCISPTKGDDKCRHFAWREQ